MKRIKIQFNPTFHEILHGLLLDFDVQQTECVHLTLLVQCDLVVEALRLPVVDPEGDGNSLAWNRIQYNQAW